MARSLQSGGLALRSHHQPELSVTIHLADDGRCLTSTTILHGSQADDVRSAQDSDSTDNESCNSANGSDSSENDSDSTQITFQTAQKMVRQSDEDQSLSDRR